MPTMPTKLVEDIARSILADYGVAKFARPPLDSLENAEWAVRRYCSHMSDGEQRLICDELWRLVSKS